MCKCKLYLKYLKLYKHFEPNYFCPVVIFAQLIFIIFDRMSDFFFNRSDDNSEMGSFIHTTGFLINNSMKCISLCISVAQKLIYYLLSL